MTNRYPCNLTLIRLIHIFTQEYWHLCLKSTKLCDFVQRGWKFPKNRFCHFETTPAEWLGSMKTISHSTHPPSLPQLVKVRSISSRPVWAAPGSAKTGSYCPHQLLLLLSLFIFSPSCKWLSFSLSPAPALHWFLLLTSAGCLNGWWISHQKNYFNKFQLWVFGNSYFWRKK